MSTSASQKIEIRVSGMSCGNCQSHVHQALIETPGVQDAVVDLAGGRATVTYDAQRVTPERMAAAVRGAGYEAEV